MTKFTTVIIAVFLLTVSFELMAGGNRGDIHASADQVQPLLSGMTAPDFNVKDAEGKVLSLKLPV